MDKTKYSTLLKPVNNEHFKRSFFLTEEAIDESLITNVFFVPKVGNEWLYLVKDSGKLDYPGGELKDGESVIFGLERMLGLELGISVKSINKLGHWILDDKYDSPLREYFPHPISAAVVFTGEVAITENRASTHLIKSANIEELNQLLRNKDRCLQADIYLASCELLMGDV
ncbi:hypothetical protein M902_3294 [Bacteriovorax sp. BAL6_X]|uniref:hypothetical protein n=1 Tax=Bacteriovorax sp. BAL6_X TaxID=1201290 RepID=UPI000386E0A3|nr:hypothetical protein [Bacteriovorax sp. BAL6_X]EPZ50667.1 hypothetical protein M902_3294 [Bacteriovorax sp. BAL6_X]